MPSQGAEMKRIFEASCPACFTRQAKSPLKFRSKNRIASPTGRPFFVPPKHSTSTPARQVSSGRLHADRGISMRSKPVAALLIDLEVAKTHSHPHVSDDNPYSEAQFKTLKYRPDFPARFGSIEDARAHCQRFFHWYNHEHRHGGIGLMAPAAVHDGTAAARRHARCRLRCLPCPLQGALPKATPAAHRRVDQPAEKGARTDTEYPHYDTNLMNRSVSLSLTRSSGEAPKNNVRGLLGMFSGAAAIPRVARTSSTM
jgi:hypothetical protein